MHNVEDRSAGGALLIIIIDHGESLGMRIRDRFWANSVAKRERETQRRGKGTSCDCCEMHDSTVAACRMPLAPGVCLGCRREQWRFPWILARKFKLLELFFGVPNRPDQTRPENREQRPETSARSNWTAGCPFFGQHDQVARFVYPSVRQPVPKVTKGQTMMPRLLPRSLPLFLSFSFSVFLPAGGCFCLRPRC